MLHVVGGRPYLDFENMLADSGRIDQIVESKIRRNLGEWEGELIGFADDVVGLCDHFKSEVDREWAVGGVDRFEVAAIIWLALILFQIQDSI